MNGSTHPLTLEGKTITFAPGLIGRQRTVALTLVDKAVMHAHLTTDEARGTARALLDLADFVDHETHADDFEIRPRSEPPPSSDATPQTVDHTVDHEVKPALVELPPDVPEAPPVVDAVPVKEDVPGLDVAVDDTAAVAPVVVEEIPVTVTENVDVDTALTSA